MIFFVAVFAPAGAYDGEKVKDLRSGSFTSCTDTLYIIKLEINFLETTRSIDLERDFFPSFFSKCRYFDHFVHYIKCGGSKCIA